MYMNQLLDMKKMVRGKELTIQKHSLELSADRVKFLETQISEYQTYIESVSTKLVEGAREHEELQILRERSSLLEKEVSESVYQTEIRQREWADKLNDVRRQMDGFVLENKDLQGDVSMLYRQIERYKNSLNEVEIIVQKYDALGHKEHEDNLRSILGDIK